MQTLSFEDELRQDGFADLDTKTVAGDKRVDVHSHPFDVRAKVLDGEITLTFKGTSQTYRAGDIFTMAAGCEHAEQCGPAGVTYTVGRRHQTAA